MAGVFVNYRSIDQPLGAAGIHSALASRFGLENVFRDCVSLDAGVDYRSGIWEALDAAAVLVVVMGPRWLSLRDESGSRLIDRERDWVRREIARALGRDLYIVPVLLRDTPEHAVAPKPEDLPEDIRELAMRQSFEFSQRRYAEDVERLVALIMRHVPGLAPDRPQKTQVADPGYQAYKAIVDVLAAVPTLENEDTRAMVVSRLRPGISGNVRHFPARRAHVMSIVRTCQDYDGGMAELLTVVHDMEGDSLPWLRVAEVAARYFPGWDG
jgi:hypothetical protein